jgi:hypothetical protein
VCAHDPAALAAVRRILVRAVSGYYERAAARLGKPAVSINIAEPIRARIGRFEFADDQCVIVA